MSFYRLAPGFPRSWPACVKPMAALAEHIHALDGTIEDMVDVLTRDFPDLPLSHIESRANIEFDRLECNRRRINEAIAQHKLAPLAVGQLADGDDEGEEDEADSFEQHPESEPGDYELQVVTTGADLYELCHQWGIFLSYDRERQDLRLSRPICPDGPLARILNKCRRGLITALSRADVAA